MSGKTSIEWATAVWNPTTGCTRVSAGCDNCYAFALHDRRYAMNRRAAHAWLDGAHATPAEARRAGAVLPWAACYDLPFSTVRVFPDRLDWPARHRRSERIFVDSMADLFHEDVPDELIDRVWTTMFEAHQHTFLVLTKRPARMRAWVTAYREGHLLGDNVWLGTSVEDQAAADERIPHLLATPAAVRFLSCEPLLGPVSLRPEWCGSDGEMGPDGKWLPAAGSVVGILGDRWIGPGIRWVIIGGESGPRARPMDLAWARSLLAQCRAAGVAPFVKQLGRTYIDREGWAALRWTGQTVRADGLVKPSDPKGGDPDGWPDDLRVREFPR